MKIFKRFVSILMGILCMLTMVMSTNAEEMDEPVRIYRDSLQITGTDAGSAEYIINLNITANSHGEIQLDLDCVKGSSSSWKNFYEIKINDTMIAPFEEMGYGGQSYKILNSINGRKFSVLESYNGNYTIYTLTPNSHFNSGEHLGTFYFYVKEPYLHTEQTINVCGIEVIIPFGDETSTDEQTQMIHELESQINDLNTELEQLRAEKEVWEQNETHLLEDLEILYKENEILVARRGDINDDGLFTIADAVLLMRYVAGTIDSIPYYPPE